MDRQAGRFREVKNTKTAGNQNFLLKTQTIRLSKSGLNLRYAELGDPAKPPVLLLHGVP